MLMELAKGILMIAVSIGVLSTAFALDEVQERLGYIEAKKCEVSLKIPPLDDRLSLIDSRTVIPVIKPMGEE